MKNGIDAWFTNYGFMSRTVFLLGGFMGVLFPLLYAIELLFLCHHDVDVMSVTEARYIFYHALRPDDGGSAMGNQFAYDIGTWLCDIDKLVGYSLFSFWSLLYGMFVSKENPLKWRPRQRELDTLLSLLEKADGSSKVFPFWLNVLIACVITLIFGGVATSFSNATSFFRFFTGDPLSWNPWFIGYRACYPIFMFIWSLHLTIGIQTIIRAPRRRTNLANRYFFVMLQFILTFLFLQGIIVSFFMPAGTYGFTLFRNPLISIWGFLLALFVLLVLLTHTPDPPDPIGENVDNLQPLVEGTTNPTSWKEFFTAIKSLPKIAITPLALVLLPILAMLFSIVFLDKAAFKIEKHKLTPYVTYLSGKTKLLNKTKPSDKSDQKLNTLNELRKVKRKTVWISADDDTRSKVSKVIINPQITDIIDAFPSHGLNN